MRIADEMKVTVSHRLRPRSRARARGKPRQPEPDPPPPESEEDVLFYRKAIAQSFPCTTPNGYGPHWSNVDDYDIPTVLRKQMD